MLAKKAFGTSAQAIIEQFTYAKMPPHLGKTINQVHLENGTYDEIVTPPEMELELNGLEARDELKINEVSHNTANTNVDRPKLKCHHCKKRRLFRNQCRSLERQKEQTENLRKNSYNENSGTNNSIPHNNTNNNINNNNYKNSNRAEKTKKTKTV